jgi:integrase
MLTFTSRRPGLRLHELDRRGYYRSPVTTAAFRQGVAPANKGRKFPAEVLTAREVYALIDGCGGGSAGKRNRALIVLLWRTGLRVGEALALYPKDVDLELGLVHVLHGKGNKARTVGIDPGARAILQAWIDARARLGAKRSEPLFCVISVPTIGQAMYSSYVRNMLKLAARRAGFEPGRRVHPHMLRHTHAYELLSEGFRLDYIQRQLGHSNPAVTGKYVSHLNPKDVVDAIQARGWPEH